MAKFVIIFLFFCQNVFLTESGSIPVKLFDTKVLQFTNVIGLCPNKNTPAKSYFSGIQCDRTSCTIQNGTVIITEDLQTNLKGTLLILRCRSRENLDSCEDFFKQDNVDYCRSINPDNIIASQSPLAVPFQPKLKCPIKKGIYRAFNYTFNLTPFLFFNPDRWYWRIKSNILSPAENNRIIGCLNAEGYLATKLKSQ